MEEISLMDVLSVFLRRRRLFAITAGAVFLVAFIFALNWSNYRSEATVEVALPEVAPEAVQTGSGSSREALADLRISYLQQKVLSTGSLVEIITKYNLYSGARAYRPMAEVADAMRKKISLDLVSMSLATPSAANKISAGQLSAIAFTLSFDYSEPLLAQQVTNELVSRFLDEDIKQRRSQAEETTSFLTAQIKSLEGSLAEQEKKLAEWRAKYGETRPETLAFNQQAATTLMMSMQNIESQITANLGTQGALRAQLAAVDPYARGQGVEGQLLTTPTIQLRAARTAYATLSAKYGSDHPDVIKARREMQGLERQAKLQGGGSGVLGGLIVDARAQLEKIKGSKGADHPDVKALENKIAKLEEQKKASAIKGVDDYKEDADNPAYLAVVAQLRAAIEQASALENQKENIKEQMEKYQQAVIQNPEVEQKLAELTRDYTNAQERYRQLQAQKMTAEMNETIEKDRVGQRLVIINPPELPTGTHPARLLFVLAGVVFACFAGAAAVGGVQLLSQSVVGPAHMAALTGVAPFVVVPHIVTGRERRLMAERHMRIVFFLLVFAAIGIGVFAYTVMPLDVLMSAIANKLRLG